MILDASIFGCPVGDMLRTPDFSETAEHSLTENKATFEVSPIGQPKVETLKIIGPFLKIKSFTKLLL